MVVFIILNVKCKNEQIKNSIRGLWILIKLARISFSFKTLIFAVVEVYKLFISLYYHPRKTKLQGVRSSLVVENGSGNSAISSYSQARTGSVSHTWFGCIPWFVVSVLLTFWHAVKTLFFVIFPVAARDLVQALSVCQSPCQLRTN